jgi:hypothetical protein
MSKPHQFVSHLIGPSTVYDDFEGLDGWMDGFNLAYVVISYTGGAGDLLFVEREDVGQGGVVEVDGHGRLGGGVSGSDLRVRRVRHTALVLSRRSWVLVAVRLRPIT